MNPEDSVFLNTLADLLNSKDEECLYKSEACDRCVLRDPDGTCIDTHIRYVARAYLRLKGL